MRIMYQKNNTWNAPCSFSFVITHTYFESIKQFNYANSNSVQFCVELK